MDQKCFALLRGEVIRATRLDGCGRVVDSACSTITTDGFVEIAMTSRVTEGETVQVRKANGTYCINDEAPSTWDGWDVTFTFCNVDPLLFTMMTGQDVVYDANGLPIGFNLRDNVNLRGQGVAVESWSNVASAGACEEGAEGQWGYSLLPFLQGGVLGDRSISNAEVTFTIQNMRTKPGSAWGTGANNVLHDGDGTTPIPLIEPIGPNDHERMFYTTLAPPTPGCSCEVEGTLATGADEGSPGSWTPDPSYAPFSFTELTTADPTASPATAWGSGSYVVLGDGTNAYWNGTAWTAGIAP